MLTMTWHDFEGCPCSALFDEDGMYLIAKRHCPIKHWNEAADLIRGEGHPFVPRDTLGPVMIARVASA